MKKLILALSILMTQYSIAQRDVNYDENKVPDYTLPELLINNDGTPVKTIEQWENIRRPKLFEYFSSFEYGRTPDDRIAVTYEVIKENPNALNGKATAKQVIFRFFNGEKEIEALLLLHIPNHREGKVPVIVGYNFQGNHSTTSDSTIVYSPSFSRLVKTDNPIWERGGQTSRWSYHKIIDRGYAIATMWYQDIYPDKEGLEDYSITSLFPNFEKNKNNPDKWQAIGAWAWGSSRIVDYLETLREIDTDKIAIMGHSRQGKAAIWAGVQDPRFKVVISNNSGCGGAALAKRVYGENIAIITNSFPHWFCPAFNQFTENEAGLPFDQHQLLALIAPRHIYVASAEEDLWADPKGEFLSLYHASPIYQLYGLEGLPSSTFPKIHEPIMTDVGYHIRSGKHDVTDYDWEQFLNFCDKCF